MLSGEVLMLNSSWHPTRLVCSGQSGYLKTDQYIKSDMIKTRAFREELLRLTGKKFLVGISWSGGGKKERVPKKSVDLRLRVSELCAVRRNCQFAIKIPKK